MQCLERRAYFAVLGTDVRFGEEGTATGVSPAYLVAVQGDKIVTAGPYRKGALRVARLLADGRPDPAFGTDGVTTIAGYGDFGSAALGPVGVYTAASPGRTNNPTLQITRLTDAGLPDLRFGARGTATVGLPVVDAGRPFYFPRVGTMAVDAEGRTVFGVTSQEKRGKTDDEYDTYGYIGRLTASGKLDKSFGHRGYIHIAGKGIRRVAVDPAGRVLVQASGGEDGQTLPPQRLTADGQPDSAFDRRVRALYRSGDLGLSAVALSNLSMSADPQGRVLLRGDAADPSDDRATELPRVYRLTVTGRLDRGFGVRGALALPRGTQIERDPVIAGDGSINLRAIADVPSNAPLLRYDADGQFRKAFAVDTTAYGNVAAVLPDGDVIVGNFYGSVTKLTTAARPSAVLTPSGVLNLYGSKRADTITVNEAGGIVVVRARGRTFSFDGDTVKSIQARLYAGRDRLTVGVDLDTDVARYDGGDTIRTADGNDGIGIGNGNSNDLETYTSTLGDVIDTGNGNDSFGGFDGDDTITFGDGDLFVNSGGGNDTIVGGTGRANIDSRFDGGNKHITLAGGGGFIELGNGDDTVRVGNGGYEVTTRGGQNRITTGSGDDTIHTNGIDTIDTGAGDDRVAIDNYNDSGYRPTSRVIHGGLGNDLIDMNDAGDAVTLYGEAGRDTLVGSYFDDLLVGGTGADRLTGGPGRDRAVIDDEDTAVDDLVPVAG